MSEEQQREIARLIAEGYTSGRLDDEQEDGSVQFVAWELSVETWKNTA